MSECYSLVKKFKSKYPLTIAWRIKAHSKIIDKHLNPDEKILYVYAGQKNDKTAEIFNTYILAFTDKRIMVATKRVLFGYFFKSITPDMYNDLTVYKGIFWGKTVIDTINEEIIISNIDGRALNDIETNVTQILMKNKERYKNVKLDKKI